jgi:hypothetical protein
MLHQKQAGSGGELVFIVRPRQAGGGVDIYSNARQAGDNGEGVFVVAKQAGGGTKVF